MPGWLRRLLAGGRRGLPSDDVSLIRAMAAGSTLKSHRFLDGRKLYRRHDLDGTAVEVPASQVDRLVRRGYLQTNHKFPAGTYLLTERGRRLAGPDEDASPPTGPRGYFGS